jgi:hypothetical protein
MIDLADPSKTVENVVPARYVARQRPWRVKLLKLGFSLSESDIFRTSEANWYPIHCSQNGRGRFGRILENRI